MNAIRGNILVESQPEVCFRGLLAHPVSHSKKCRPGVGERLAALANSVEAPGQLLQEVTTELIGGSDAIDLDDVLDAIVLGINLDIQRSSASVFTGLLGRGSSWATDANAVLGNRFHSQSQLP